MIFSAQNFLEDMALVMCIAALAAVVCQLLRQPLLVGYLVAGMVVGPHIPGVYADVHRVELVSDLGVTLLIFSIGLEFKFRRLMRLAPTAGSVALFQILSMIGLGYLAGRIMGWTPFESLLTGAVVSISGAVILAKAFEEAQVEPRVRELVFGVVLCEDVLAILILAVLITIANGGVPSLRALTITVSRLGSFILALILAGLFTIPFLVRWIARLKRPEVLLIAALGLCFGFATLAERTGYTVVLGAFLAGSLVAESGHGAEVDELIAPVRQIFGAMFFVSVGMLVDPRLLAKYWPALAALGALVIVGKIVSVSLASLLIGERPNIAIKSGFAMAQIGVFSFLIAEVGTHGNPKHNSLYSLAVGISAITAFLSPFLIRLSNSAADSIDRHLPMPVRSAVSQYGGWIERLRKASQSEG